nr:hypothetical protein [Diaporthe pseudophoenicicola chrysovirus 1]
MSEGDKRNWRDKAYLGLEIIGVVLTCPCTGWIIAYRLMKAATD